MAQHKFSITIAKLVGHNAKGYILIETFETSEGLRTRLAWGVLESYDDALAVQRFLREGRQPPANLYAKSRA